jgi:hypothetical protein
MQKGKETSRSKTMPFKQCFNETSNKYSSFGALHTLFLRLQKWACARGASQATAANLA